EPNVWRLYIHVKPHLFTKCYNRIAPFSHPVPVWALSSHPGRACDSWPMPPSHPISACTGKTGPSQLRRSQKAFSRVGGGKCANPSLANFVGVLMYGAPPYQPVGLRRSRIYGTHVIRRHGIMDLELTPIRTRGRAARPLSAEVVRELRIEDLGLLEEEK